MGRTLNDRDWREFAARQRSLAKRAAEEGNLELSRELAEIARDAEREAVRAAA